MAAISKSEECAMNSTLDNPTIAREQTADIKGRHIPSIRFFLFLFVIVVLCSGFVFVVGYRIFEKTSVSSNRDALSYDLGTIYISDPNEKIVAPPFNIFNPYSKKLSYLRQSSSCSCAGSFPDELSFSPNGYITINFSSNSIPLPKPLSRRWRAEYSEQSNQAPPLIVEYTALLVPRLSVKYKDDRNHELQSNSPTFKMPARGKVDFIVEVESRQPSREKMVDISLRINQNSSIEIDSKLISQNTFQDEFGHLTRESYAISASEKRIAESPDNNLLSFEFTQSELAQAKFQVLIQRDNPITLSPSTVFLRFDSALAKESYVKLESHSSFSIRDVNTNIEGLKAFSETDGMNRVHRIRIIRDNESSSNNLHNSDFLALRGDVHVVTSHPDAAVIKIPTFVLSSKNTDR